MSYRTRLGGELRAADAGTRVTLAGWVARRRDHGGLVFVDLRDRGGIVQLVLDPEQAPERRTRLRNEFVIQVEGVVHARGRPRPSTRSCPPARSRSGSSGWRCCRAAAVLPFQLDDEGVDETLRLHHRYLDLRRDEMRHNLWTRFRLTQIIRRHMEDNGFWELETPILYKSTPEGAKEFLVPTSSHPGKFYALPQSPQTFKQLYVIAGYERYYQIARCFRDEATRADRTRRVHAARHRDGVPRARGAVRAAGGTVRAGLARAAGRRADDAVPPPELGRGHAALRLRQARPALRLRDRRRHRRACAAPSSRPSAG